MSVVGTVIVVLVLSSALCFLHSYLATVRRREEHDRAREEQLAREQRAREEQPQEQQQEHLHVDLVPERRLLRDVLQVLRSQARVDDFASRGGKVYFCESCCCCATDSC